jgi:hypothetical protein
MVVIDDGRMPKAFRENDVAAETHNVNKLQQTTSSVLIIILLLDLSYLLAVICVFYVDGCLQSKRFLNEFADL